jgi:hypothetical protein
MLDNLERVLSEKKHRMDEQSNNYAAVRDDWLEKIDSLYTTIKSWLAPIEEKGYAIISDYTVSIFEELLGTYEAPAMKVSFFSGEKVEMVPKGLHVVAGRGRVDMRLGPREVMIIGQDEEPGWFFAERVGRGKPRRFEFNQDNFEQLLQDLLETM